MEKAIWKRAAGLSFWEAYAPWYQQWLEHNTYHEGIVSFVQSVARPGWNVLDIGAGSGVLSLPLLKKGCAVTALEPSEAMRHLLHENVCRHKKNIHIEAQPWEEIPEKNYFRYDLTIACNSLHLTPLGFRRALDKMFHHQPKRVLVVSEFVTPQMKIPLIKNGYTLCYGRLEQVKSAFVYHSIEEAGRHWQIMNGRTPGKKELEMLKTKCVLKNHHLCLEEKVWVGIFYWKRCHTSLHHEHATIYENGFHHIVALHHHI